LLNLAKLTRKFHLSFAALLLTLTHAMLNGGNLAKLLLLPLPKFDSDV